jgi:hypothetical protein
VQVEAPHQHLDAAEADHIATLDLTRPRVSERQQASAAFNLEDRDQRSAKLRWSHFHEPAAVLVITAIALAGVQIGSRAAGLASQPLLQLDPHVQTFTNGGMNSRCL